VHLGTATYNTDVCNLPFCLWSSVEQARVAYHIRCGMRLVLIHNHHRRGVWCKVKVDRRIRSSCRPGQSETSPLIHQRTLSLFGSNPGTWIMTSPINGNMHCKKCPFYCQCGSLLFGVCMHGPAIWWAAPRKYPQLVHLIGITNPVYAAGNILILSCVVATNLSQGNSIVSASIHLRTGVYIQSFSTVINTKSCALLTFQARLIDRVVTNCNIYLSV
jgi:hypothetical protein